MWNFLASGPAVGAAIVLFDGNPARPDLDGAVAAGRGDRDDVLRHLGAVTCWPAARPGWCRARSPTCPRCAASVPPVRRCRRRASAGCTSRVGDDVQLQSLSGGTDVCTGFVGGVPLLPVYAGEIACRCLGAQGGGVLRRRHAGHRRARRAGDHRTDAEHAGGLLERPRRHPLPEAYFDVYPGVLQRAVGGCVARGAPAGSRSGHRCRPTPASSTRCCST